VLFCRFHFPVTVHISKQWNAYLGAYKVLSQKHWYFVEVGTLHLKAYCDADFAGEPEGNDKPMRSTSGLVVYMHGVGPLYWKAQL